MTKFFVFSWMAVIKLQLFSFIQKKNSDFLNRPPNTNLYNVQCFIVVWKVRECIELFHWPLICLLTPEKKLRLFIILIVLHLKYTLNVMDSINKSIFSLLSFGTLTGCSIQLCTCQTIFCHKLLGWVFSPIGQYLVKLKLKYTILLYTFLYSWYTHTLWSPREAAPPEGLPSKAQAF